MCVIHICSDVTFVRHWYSSTGRVRERAVKKALARVLHAVGTSQAHTAGEAAHCVHAQQHFDARELGG